jgi:hypothetical protein
VSKEDQEALAQLQEAVKVLTATKKP